MKKLIALILLFVMLATTFVGCNEPATKPPASDPPGMEQPGDQPGTGDSGTSIPGTGDSGSSTPGTGDSGSSTPGSGDSGSGDSSTGDAGLPTPDVAKEPIAPLGFTRKYGDIQGVDGVEPFGTYWFKGSNKISADLSKNPALAYSLTISDTTSFSKLPVGYDSAALIEWGKDPGLNVDILHKHGFTGKGATIAYVDQPVSWHEQYSGSNIHVKNNSDTDHSMHGPAVLSLLAGKNIGTAPEAEVYFYGHAAWLADQRTHAECLYQIIEQNKSLPDHQKIRMVAFSDGIDTSEGYAEEFQAAVDACQKAGIMVWFCQEYGSVSFLPMSDKNNYNNLVLDQWWNESSIPKLVFVPASGRTSAATMDGSEYIYWPTGGLSWTMPYVLGLYAIAIQIDPTLTQNDLRDLIVSTAYDLNGMPIINPVGFVCAVLQRVGRGDEAQAMLDEVSARTKYTYAIMDTANMTKEDLTSVGKYLASITDSQVLVVDASFFASAKELYVAMKEDASKRGGEIVGVQIFGNSDLVPAFNVKYKVQINNAIDEGGTVLTDLFYGNFNNDPQVITNGYNVMDHFAQNWDVDLVPQWKVARLPLAKGEFSAFFDKYNQFVLDTGLQRQDLVNFSNPIFASTRHVDDMGVFLGRMDKEFNLLDVPYRLYGNLVGQYPVSTDVLGGFTAENLAAENDIGMAEFIINTHGQPDNMDKCYYINNKEIRESFVNMDTINQVLDGNPYYLDCWTCLNGAGMIDNLTTTALNGKCVGMFSATIVISNNGVDNKAAVDQMKNSNFYYFYYNYLKALNQGKSRSQAFCDAQQAYATALIADGADGTDWAANYQYNLYNVFAYHNFGVFEPNVPLLAMTNHSGYIAQAGQSVPKEEQKPQGGQSTSNTIKLTDGKPVGDAQNVEYRTQNNLKTGTFEIHSVKTQKLDNGYIRFTVECTVHEGMRFSVFNPPNGDVFLLTGGPTTGEKQTIVYDLLESDVKATSNITMKFFVSGGDDYASIYFSTSQIFNQSGQQQGGQTTSSTIKLTDGKPVGNAKNIQYGTYNGLKKGTFEIHGFTAQKLDNGYVRIVLECTLPKGMLLYAYGHPDTNVIMLKGGPTTGVRQKIQYDLLEKAINKVSLIVMNFYFDDNNHVLIDFNTSQIS
ncbi:MAG: hypothetical protein E7344_02475 [Clostridiales bacterium]|nr:hypothetical protein [Clostridiales bacterium]